MKKRKTNELIERIKAPTPPFFKKIIKIGLTVGAVGVTLLSAPVALPIVITKIAGYLATAGLVATAVAAITKKNETVLQ